MSQAAMEVTIGSSQKCYVISHAELLCSFQETGNMHSDKILIDSWVSGVFKQSSQKFNQAELR